MENSAEPTRLLPKETIMENIFTSCDTENSGCVAASKLVEFIQPYIQRKKSAVSNLLRMLDPHGTNCLLSKSSFLEIMSNWIDSFEEEPTTSSECEILNVSCNSSENLKSTESFLEGSISKDTLENFNSSAVSVASAEILSPNKSSAVETIFLEERITELMHLKRKLMEEIDELRILLSHSEEQCETLKKDAERISRRLISEQQVNHQLQKERKDVDDMRETASSYLKQIESLKKELVDRERNSAEMRDKINQLESEKLALENKLDGYMKRECHLKKKMKVIETDSQVKEDDILTLQTANCQLKEKISEYHSMCEHFKNINEELKEEIQAWESKFREDLSKTYSVIYPTKLSPSSKSSPEVKSCKYPISSPALPKSDKQSRLSNYSPFARVYSPRPFNSPRLLQQLSNPITLNWSPVTFYSPDHNQDLPERCFKTSTPKGVFHSERHLLDITPRGDGTPALLQTIPEETTKADDAEIKIVADKQNHLTCVLDTEDPKMNGNSGDSTHLQSSEEDLDWMGNSIKFSQNASTFESLRAELSVAHKCACELHKCFTVIERLQAENEKYEENKMQNENNVKVLQSEIEDLKSQISFKDDKETMLMDIRSDLETKLANSKSQLNELKLKLDEKIMVENLEQHYKNNMEVSLQLQKLMEENEELKLQVVKLETSLKCYQEMEESHIALKEKLSEALENQTISSDYQTTLNGHISELNEKVLNITTERDKLSREYHLLQLEIETRNTEIDQLKINLEQQVESSNSHKNLQEAKLKLKDEEIKKLSKELKERKELNNNLNRDIDIQNAQLNLKSEEVLELKELVRIFRESATDKELKITEFIRDIEGSKDVYRQEIERYENIVKELNLLGIQQQKDYDNLNNNFLMLKETNASLSCELEQVKEKHKYIKELYSRAMEDCEQILDEKNKMQCVLTRQIHKSNLKDRKSLEHMDLLAEKETLLEDRADWDKIQESIRNKLNGDFSDASSELSSSDSKSALKGNSKKGARKNNFEKMQIKIDRLQCKIEEQEQMLAEERYKITTLKSKYNEDLPALVKEMQWQLQESNERLGALSNAFKGKNLTGTTHRHLVKSPLTLPSSYISMDMTNARCIQTLTLEKDMYWMSEVLQLKHLVDRTWQLSDCLNASSKSCLEEVGLLHTNGQGEHLTLPSPPKKFLLKPPTLILRPDSPDSPSVLNEENSDEKISRKKHITTVDACIVNSLATNGQEGSPPTATESASIPNSFPCLSDEVIQSLKQLESNSRQTLLRQQIEEKFQNLCHILVLEDESKEQHVKNVNCAIEELSDVIRGNIDLGVQHEDAITDTSCTSMLAEQSDAIQSNNQNFAKMQYYANLEKMKPKSSRCRFTRRLLTGTVMFLFGVIIVGLTAFITNVNKPVFGSSCQSISWSYLTWEELLALFGIRLYRVGPPPY